MKRILVLSTVLLLTVAAHAAPITPGDLVIYRVGDGTAALGTTAAAVFLDEYTITGTFVQSILAPAMTATGNSTTEGVISRSQDGSALIFTGYRKAAGLPSPSADTYLVTSRVIGTITTAGLPDTTTTMINDNGVTTANTIRSATSVSGTVGSPLWVSTSTRVSYDVSGLGSAAGTTQIDLRNSRQVNMSGNVLYAANGSTAITGKVQQYGVLPVGATVATPIVTLATADAVNGFALFDLSPGFAADAAGNDTLYALSTVENLLRKYTWDGTAWISSGSISAGGTLNLTGFVSGGNANLFLTSSSSLFSYTDASGYGGAEAGSLSAALTTAGLNTAFRGIGMLEVPEPSMLALSLVGGLVLLAWRRRA